MKTAKDGRRLTVSSHWALLHDEKNQPSGIVQVNKDLTAGKEQERRRANGDVRQLSDMLSLTIGAQDGQRTPAVARTTDLLSGAGFPVSVSDDIVAAMWQKWMFIAAACALNCLLGGSVGEIIAVDGGDETARAIVGETRAVATAAGYPLPVIEMFCVPLFAVMLAELPAPAPNTVM